MKKDKDSKIALRKSGLGRGLSALISSNAAQKSGESSGSSLSVVPGGVSGTGVREVELSKLSPDEAQPRKSFSQQSLEELAASIKEVGIISPIVVKPAGSGFQIIAGERRFRAAKIAGLQRVPIIVREESGARETLEIALIENIQRSDLTPIEEALAYRRLIDEYGLTQREVAERVAKDRTSVANSLRLLQLPEQIRMSIENGDISVGHAKAILTVKEPAAQLGLLKKVIDEGLSVRALEEIVARNISLRGDSKPKALASSSGSHGESSDLERRLERVLGTKVRIRRKSKGDAGRIEIDFFSNDEFERLLQTIGA